MSFRDKTKALVQDEIAFKKLQTYANLIEQSNQVINLTGLSGDKLWEEGIYESIVSLKAVFEKGCRSLLDIGSGVGFPSIPFLITRSEIEATLLEPISKRAKFLQKVISTLKLNAHVVQDRAEIFVPLSKYDLITARAVAPLKILLEVTHHLGDIGTRFVFIKGPNVQNEIASAREIIKQLEIVLSLTKVLDVKNRDVQLVVFDKQKKTPRGIPRPWNAIIKDRN